ncbi:MAG: sortase [Actinomycetota bacterium]
MTDVGSARRRSAGRTVVALGVLCGIAALGVVAYAAYELWGTGAEERAVQAELRTSFDRAASTVDESAESSDPADPLAVAAPVEVPADAPAIRRLPGGVDAAVAAAQFPADGEALARLQIPAIGVDKFVMRDVDVASLQVGPGHYVGTVRPGFEGNAAIAGHRTTYGAPFGRVDELQPGDEVTVYSADGLFTYVVLDPAEAFGDRLDDVNRVEGGHVVVDPDDTWVVAEYGDARLTLTSCHPEFTSRDRIVVVAELVSEVIPRADIFAGLGEAELLELVSEDLSVVDAFS